MASASPAQPLTLSLSQLQEVRDCMRQRTLEGLQQDHQQIKALPAYFSPPRTDLAGEALVMDTGGTNARAARVKLTPGREPELLEGPVVASLPVRDAARPLDAEGFFDFQAELLDRLGGDSELPVGYCFSYPSQVHPDRDATLIAWTKGIDIPGVEGQKVGALLREALKKRGRNPRQISVLNDTVACLLGGAILRPEYASSTIGLICATGVNIAAFFSGKDSPKLSIPDGQSMAINLESGNLHPPHLQKVDEQLDQASENPGAQRIEKAVSGHYLPFVLQHSGYAPEGFDPLQGSAQLVEYMGQAESTPDTALWSKAILERSAQLTAASLAGAADLLPADQPLQILAEGSLFWKAPEYESTVEKILHQLLGEQRKIEIYTHSHANILGSAYAALAE